MIKIPDLARIVWEAQRAYFLTLKDPDHVAWSYLTKAKQDKIIAAISAHLSGTAPATVRQTARELVEDALLAAICGVFAGDTKP